jgi:hypothetical protein
MGRSRWGRKKASSARRPRNRKMAPGRPKRMSRAGTRMRNASRRVVARRVVACLVAWVGPILFKHHHRS